MTIVIKLANKLSTTKRFMLKVRLRYHNRNEDIMERTKVEDEMEVGRICGERGQNKVV